jgi:hypothetical protein
LPASQLNEFADHLTKVCMPECSVGLP